MVMICVDLFVIIIGIILLLCNCHVNTVYALYTHCITLSIVGLIGSALGNNAHVYWTCVCCCADDEITRGLSAQWGLTCC